jgi:hypothetical protein
LTLPHVTASPAQRALAYRAGVGKILAREVIGFLPMIYFRFDNALSAAIDTAFEPISAA